MHRNHGPVDIWSVGLYVGDKAREFLRNRVANGIRDVDDRRARIDRRRENPAEEIRLAARRIFCGKLDIAAVVLCVAHRGCGSLDDLFRSHAELVLHVNGRSRDEGVNARALCLADRFPGGVDILFERSGKGGDAHIFHRAGNFPHCGCVAGARCRKPGLHDIDPELFELTRNLELFSQVHAAAGRLLAIPQGRVKNVYLPGHVYSSCDFGIPRSRRKGFKVSNY